MRIRVGRICQSYSDARQRRILNSALIWSQFKVYDRRIPLRERGVRFPGMTVKRVLGWDTLNCLWRGSPTIGPTSFFSPPAQLCTVTCVHVNNWNIVVCDVMQLIQQHHAYHSWQLKLDLFFASVYNLKISWMTMQVEKNGTCTYYLKGEGFVIWLVVVLRIYVALAIFQPYRDRR